jgi:hypothetical protein
MEGVSPTSLICNLPHFETPLGIVSQLGMYLAQVSALVQPVSCAQLRTPGPPWLATSPAQQAKYTEAVSMAALLGSQKLGLHLGVNEKRKLHSRLLLLTARLLPGVPDFSSWF